MDSWLPLKQTNKQKLQISLGWSEEYHNRFGLLQASVCAPSDLGILALFIWEQVYKLNLFKEKKTGNLREEINSQLLIIINWLLSKDIVVSLNSWEWWYFLVSLLQTSSIVCNHSFSGEMISLLERFGRQRRPGNCHIFKSHPNDDMMAATLD